MVSLVVKLLTLDTAPNTVFLVWFFLSAPRPLGSCYQLWCYRHACMIDQLVLTETQALLVLRQMCTHRKQSPFHLPVKTFVKGPNYYGLYYKCVSKHFIINWNLAS